MYLICNYDYWGRHPQEFTSYKKAFKVFKILNDNTNTLEYWNMRNQTRKVIIDRRKNRYGR